MISIIVPVYNGEKYIINCANALMSQSYQDIEIIFINDGSKDKTGNILDAVSEQDSRVKVIHKENGGVSAARNKGLSIATGEYIMFCDADDIPQKNWCEELLLCIQKFPNSMPICAVLKVFASNLSENSLFTLSEDKCNEEYTHFTKKDLLSISDTGLLDTLWNKIFSNEIIKTNCIYFDETISNGEDNLFIYEYLAKIHGNTVFLNKVLYSYIQQNPDSLSKQAPYDKIVTAEKAFYAQKNLFEKIQFFDVISKNEFYNCHLNNFIRLLGNILNNKQYSRKQRFSKSTSALKLPGFQECLFNVTPESSYHCKLIKIYRSKLMGMLFNLKRIFLTTI